MRRELSSKRSVLVLRGLIRYPDLSELDETVFELVFIFNLAVECFGSTLVRRPALPEVSFIGSEFSSSDEQHPNAHKFKNFSFL